MKRERIIIFSSFLIFGFILFSGCGKKENAIKPESVSVDKAVKTSYESVEVGENDPLVYLQALDAKASSFDETPDWAPEPDAMAPVDGNMLTRWSSGYEGASEWITFDLGRESVASNVIIRWERAYATKYKILVSNNNEDWVEVYNETDCKGVAVESTFPAVKCRYLKVLCLEKVEEKWGISIWEIEIYGPKSFNPQSTILKENYLSTAEDEKKKEEAMKLIEEFAAAPVPVADDPVQQGAVYTSWMSDELLMPASDITLVSLKKMGFDSVAIMIPAYQEDLDSPEVFTNDSPGGDTPTDDSIIHAINTCHKLGIRVMLKPHIDPRTDEARVNIIPSEAWFNSYEKLILRYAVIAEKNSVEIFSIGTELEGTTFDMWDARWREIIKKVKEVYKGKLTYSANWTEYKEVPFWDEMDFIGIDAYFPLTTKDNPAQEELAAAWNKTADDIQLWLNENGLTNKSVIFTEIGYTSTTGTNRQPWVAITTIENQDEQANSLEATFSVLKERPWFKGYYLWQYMPQERWSPLGFTVRDKKAEQVVAEWNKRFI